MELTGHYRFNQGKVKSAMENPRHVTKVKELEENLYEEKYNE